jgi:DNA-binding MarR family transcriptional regulator
LKVQLIFREGSLTILALDTYRIINEVFLLGDDIDRQLFSYFSLTVRQYHLLNWLSIRGECGLSELADLLLCDKSNVTGMVRRLTSANLIERVPNPDKRFTKIRLTPHGQSVHDQAEKALTDSIAARFEHVPETEHLELQGLLQHMHQRLHLHLETLAQNGNGNGYEPVPEE